MTNPLASISPLAKRIRLAADIDRLRREAGFTQAALARAIGQSRQAVTRVENPMTNLERGIVADHVRDILIACGLPSADPEHQRIMELMWSARRDGWWERGFPQMGERQRVVAAAELGAREISEYHPYLPPGLAQTEAFARHGAGDAENDKAAVDGIAAGRMQRQRTVFAADVRYNLVLEELAVRRPIAPPDVMREQLLHLIELGQRPGVSVRVLPIDAPLGVGHVPTAPCSIYTYPDPLDPQLVVIDTFHKDHVVIDQEGVQVYAQLFERLRSAALSDADSAAFIQKVADDLPGAGS